MQESYLPDAIDLSLVKRVLVIKLRHFGDVLLTSPVFTALGSARPDAEIDALVYAETAPMLSGHPSISTVHTIDRSWKKQGLRSQWRNERNLMTALQNRHYDLIVHLTEHARGARLARRLRPRYSVAQAYPEKRGRSWRNSFSHIYKIPAKPRHTVEIHLDALRRLGIYPTAADRKLVIVPGSDAIDKMTALLAEHNFSKKAYILIHPTSRWMFKGWTRQGFSRLIRKLCEDGHQIILTSAPDPAEMEVIKQITADLDEKSLVNLAGQLSLKELSAFIEQAKCFIGLDSVPMHIASATATPCVVLFGPSDELTWGPWQVSHRLITENVSCRPCGLDGCGNGKVSDCLMAIDTERVIAAVRDILAGSAVRHRP